MSDLISRQEAIEFIDHLLSQSCEDGKDDFVGGMRVGYYSIRTVIKYLPSAQRKKGKWILDTFQIRCSQCNKLFSDNLFPSNYCPSCGADMRGDTDE